MQIHPCILAACLALPAGVEEVAGPDPSRLVELLRRAEPDAHFLRGSIEAYDDKLERQPGGVRDPFTRLTHIKYDLALQGQMQLVQVNNLIKDGWYATWLICKNDEYYFSLARGTHGWLLLDVQMLDRLPKQKGSQFSTFTGHFSHVHSLSGRRLCELLTDSEYTIASASIGPRLHEVTGRRKAQEASGLLQFSARIVTSEDHQGAYIGHAKTIVKDNQGRIAERELLNRIQLSLGAPPLMESWEQVRTKDNPLEDFEYLRIYDTQAVSKDADKSVFYLSYYGLPEPEFGSLPLPHESSRFLWFFVTVGVGVILVVFGNNLRTRPSAVALPSPNLPPSH